jgi:hypothetical protein
MLTSCTDNFLFSEKRFWNHQIPAAGPNYEPITCSQGPVKQKHITYTKERFRAAGLLHPAANFIYELKAKSLRCEMRATDIATGQSAGPSAATRI